MILIAPNSFKNALSNMDAALAIQKGILSFEQGTKTTLLPIADGGDDTMTTLVRALDGTYVSCTVHDPLLRPIKAVYGIVWYRGVKTAVIEMANAAGLKLLSPKEYDILRTTTFGVEEMIVHGAKAGCQAILLCIGGSATNDGGLGMAMALGYEFLDAAGAVLPPLTTSLKSVAKIRDDLVPEAIKNLDVSVLCDVDNLICGKEGASYVYGLQKGAKEEMLPLLDQHLHDFTVQLNQHFHRDFFCLKGGGAAGGLGVGALAFLKAQMKPGADTLFEMIGIEAHLSNADFIITGEGQLDLQSAFGKAPSSLLALSKKYQKPILMLCGSYKGPVWDYIDAGFSFVYAIQKSPTSLSSAIKNTASDLTEAAYNIMNLYRTFA